MKYAFLIVLAACGQPKSTGSTTGGTRSMAALAALMKNEINPAFSKLTFLIRHADTMQEDPASKDELQQAALVLRGAMTKLRGWATPPTESAQGREVFYTFATSVDGTTTKLFDSINLGDMRSARAQLQQIADTCNNCHHFFRLDLRDSVVGEPYVDRRLSFFMH